VNISSSNQIIGSIILIAQS